jgi:hypothetical protein
MSALKKLETIPNHQYFIYQSIDQSPSSSLVSKLEILKEKAQKIMAFSRLAGLTEI